MTLEIANVKNIIVHASHTPDDKEITVDELTRMHRMRGAIDNKHHYVITRDGVENKARNITRPGISSHDKDTNKTSVSVCLIGTKNFTDKQMAQLRKSLNSLVDLFYKAKVVSHSDIEVEAEICPGFDVAKWYYTEGK